MGGTRAMFRTKRQMANAATKASSRRPRSRSFSDHVDYLGLDDDVGAAARQNAHHPGQSSSSGGTRRARSRSCGPKSNTATSRRGRSLSRGRSNSRGQSLSRQNNKNSSNGNTTSKGGSFLESLRRRSRSRSRPRRPSGVNREGNTNAIDPNERWQTIVKTTGMLPSKIYDQVNVRSENGFVGSRSGADGRIVQGSRIPAQAPASEAKHTGKDRHSRCTKQPRQTPQRTRRTAVSKGQTEHIRPAASSAAAAAAAAAAGGGGCRRSTAATAGGSGAASNRMKAPAERPSPSRFPAKSQSLPPPKRRHSFDGMDDDRILDLDDMFDEDAANCRGKVEEDHHTVTAASVRTASSHERSRKSSLGQNSKMSAGTHSTRTSTCSRSSASVGRSRGRASQPPRDQQGQQQHPPDASRSAPSKLMTHQPMPASGAASVLSCGSRVSSGSCSRRSAPVMSSRHPAQPCPSRIKFTGSGPSPTVDSIRLRARQQKQQEEKQEASRNRLKHSQLSMDDFRPPMEDALMSKHQCQQVDTANALTSMRPATIGNEDYVVALKDHEGPSGGTVPRPITRAASRGRCRGRREYYQDNEDDDLLQRSHRSLGRSRSRSVGRKERKERRKAEREERAERTMRRRASSRSRRRSSKDDATDDEEDGSTQRHKDAADIHQLTKAAETTPWGETYPSLPSDEFDDDEREWQVDKTINEDKLQRRLMKLTKGRNQRAESRPSPSRVRTGPHSVQEQRKVVETLHNSFASAVAIEDIDEDVFSSYPTDNVRSSMNINKEKEENESVVSSSTADSAPGGSMHFDGERIDYSGNEKYQSNHRCVLEDPFGLLDPDDESNDSEQFKTADGWVKRNYEGGKAA